MLLCMCRCWLIQRFLKWKRKVRRWLRILVVIVMRLVLTIEVLVGNHSNQIVILMISMAPQAAVKVIPIVVGKAKTKILVIKTAADT